MKKASINKGSREFNPLNWYNKSTNLLAAAGSVWYCSHHENSTEIAEELEFGVGFRLEAATPDPYLMLCGMSLKSLLKAVIVVSDKQELLLSHNLIELADEAEIDLSNEEKKFMTLLGEYVVWAARYTVPQRDVDSKADHLYELRSSIFFDKTRLSATSEVDIFVPKEIVATEWREFKKFWNKISGVYWEKAHSAFPES